MESHMPMGQGLAGWRGPVRPAGRCHNYTTWSFTMFVFSDIFASSNISINQPRNCH